MENQGVPILKVDMVYSSTAVFMGFVLFDLIFFF